MSQRYGPQPRHLNQPEPDELTEIVLSRLDIAGQLLLNTNYFREDFIQVEPPLTAVRQKMDGLGTALGEIWNRIYLARMTHAAILGVHSSSSLTELPFLQGRPTEEQLHDALLNLRMPHSNQQLGTYLLHLASSGDLNPKGDRVHTFEARLRTSLGRTLLLACERTEHDLPSRQLVSTEWRVFFGSVAEAAVNQAVATTPSLLMSHASAEVILEGTFGDTTDGLHVPKKTYREQILPTGLSNKARPADMWEVTGTQPIEDQLDALSQYAADILLYMPS